MSTFRMMKTTCGLCGHVFETRTLTSTNSFGSPDLDLRPPQMRRSTMHMWITKCPNCGYVHSDIKRNGKMHKTFIKSKDYLMCEGAKLMSGLACNFYKYALILLREEEMLKSYDAFLYAAWACDDMEDEKGAVFCRNKAIALYDENLFGENANLILRHIDVLRRAGKFSEALSLIQSTEWKEELLQKIAKFQEELSRRKDAACYRVADC